MQTERILPPGIIDDSSLAYAALVDRFDALDPSVTLVDLIDRVDASALPSLLAQFHVDFVRPGSGERALREKVAGSVAWHRRKGTPDAVAGLVEEMTGLRPAIWERRYFALGVSGLGGAVHAPPRPGFLAGLSRLGVAGLGMPDLWFVADVVFSGKEARAAGVTAGDVEPLAAAVRPARTWTTVRFWPFVLGDGVYGRLGLDVFEGRRSINPTVPGESAGEWIPEFFTPFLLGDPAYGRLGIALL